MCLACGASLVGRRADARACSSRCRVALHRRGPLPRSELLAAAYGFEARDLWRTPPQVFHHYDRAYRFTLDAAATEFDALCARWISPAEDALAVSWAERAGPGGAAWCNPPYSKAAGGLLAWVEKALAEAAAGLPVVLLVPPATDAHYWTPIDAQVGEGRGRVDLVRGRLAFHHPETGRPVAGNRGGSAIVHLWPERRDGAGYHRVELQELLACGDGPA